MEIPRRQFVKLSTMSALLAGCTVEGGPQLHLLQYSGAISEEARR